MIERTHMAEDGSTNHSQDRVTSTSLLPTRRLAEPTLRINDDDAYDVDHNDNDSAATNNHSAHHKQADTTHY